MFRTRRLPFKLSLLAVTAGIVTIVSLGGCPVAQQPTTPDTGDQNQVDDQPPGTNNQRPGSRPIPPLPTDEGDDSTFDDTVNPPIPPGGGGGAGGGGDDGGQDTTALRVSIIGPITNLEVTRNQPVEVEYRVDGEAQNVELLYDLEGGASGTVFRANLNVEGKVAFVTDVPGVYTLSIRATGASEQVVQRVPGRVTVVGDAVVTFSKPTQDLVIRPNVPVAVAYSVESLASSINGEVFVDPDRALDGDETRVLSSSLRIVSANIETQGLVLGINYSIYVEITDSVNQKSGRIYSPYRFRIVPAPTIRVDAPTGDETINAGDPVRVEFVGGDPEGIATITVFIDSDQFFDGNEDPVATDLPITSTQYDVDTSGLVAGTYYFGAWVTDNISGDVFAHDYAPGTRTIPGITISTPTTDQTIRPPAAVEMRWTAVYPASAFRAHEVVVGKDADDDGRPDGPLTVLAGGFNPGPNSYLVSSVGLKGRYLVGVRLTDNNNREITGFARGDLIVINDAPTVRINEPSDFIALRTPGAPPVPMNFIIGDAEGQSGLLDIDVIVARDDDADGQPDGAPVFEVTSPNFRIGNNNYNFDANALDAAGLINDANHDGWGLFLLGVRVVDDAGQQAIAWVSDGLYLDNVEPAIELDEPSGNLTRDRIGTLDVQISVSDTSPTAVRVLLDRDLNPNNNFDGFVLVDWTIFLPNETQQFVIDLTTVDSGFYFYYLEVTDLAGITAHYLPKGVSDPAQARRLWIRDRLIGTFRMDDLTDSPNGAILQGFNFNDLGGSAMARVPDVDNDGDDEFIVVSRFGKPYIINNNSGVGFGEAYLVYGNGGNNNINDPNPLRGAQTLNAVGRGSISGLAFAGIRIPLNAQANTTGMTEGITDVAVVGDMDGDRLPDIVLGMPRAESINLGETNVTVQHPELLPDISGMGNLEYNAFYGNPPTWHRDEAQFTRGGVVMVSSHNSSITNERVLNRKSDRVIDLHEIGQMFSNMGRPSLKPYIIGAALNDPPGGCADCSPERADCNGDGTEEAQEQEYESWTVFWDVVFNWGGEGLAHGPGGFHQPWTAVPANPPLANPSSHPPRPPFIFYPDLRPCDVPGCEVRNVWYVWPPQPFGPFPCSQRNNVQAWDVGGQTSHWTGFYGSLSPEVSIRDFSVGARVLGQRVGDRFGTSVSSDSTWLYISAPRHRVLVEDVPLLPDPGGARNRAGVVYQYRIDTRTSQFGRTRSQLWMEPFSFDSNDDGTPDTTATWPTVDAEGAKGADTTMPVPHQYIVETVGSTRGNPPGGEYNFESDCPPGYDAGFGGAQANAAGGCYQPYAVGTVGYYIDRTPQIVGPHVNAEISFVRNVGDVNDDGYEDFAVGSNKIRENFSDPQNPTGATLGGIFIVYSRNPGLEGDYLLEDLARAPNDTRRLAGVLLKGENDGEPIARVFDRAGDFNGDGVDDVVVGSERGSGGRGEAIVIFGSRSLISPQGGYTLSDIVDEGRAIRFVGAHAGDLAGANVAGVGDVDFDGYGDILIAAPNVDHLNDTTGGPGAVYLIYGSPDHRAGVVDLRLVGTPDLPGVVFVGRKVGDFLGGNDPAFVFPDRFPDGGDPVYSQGVAALGDINGDNRADYAVSAIMADPFNKTNAGEVYILYGRGDRPIFLP